jgi:hypothetical protein
MFKYNIQILPDTLLGENPYLTQVRTHKKKRINKKWAKRYGYVTKYKSFNTVVFNNTVFMTKQVFQDLQRGIRNEQA